MDGIASTDADLRLLAVVVGVTLTILVVVGVVIVFSVANLYIAHSTL